MASIYRLLIILCIISSASNALAQHAGFTRVLQNQPDRVTTFCVPNNDQNRKLLDNEGISIKYLADDWAFITVTPRWIQESITNNRLTDFYYEIAPPALLSDTARMHHFVDDVHMGTGGLTSSYTGEGVIVGYVDTGIDFNHDDFKNADGTTRVIRYWDQTMPDNSSSPAPYGYGYAWTEAEINSGSCTSMDDSGHGSTVAGQGSGNGLANGTNKGMAPDSKIIMVETDFSRPNWTLTVADACDYLFKVADSLGMPAVMNLSVGSYIGSHDGNDPAAEAMESMLDAQPGRIIIGAAGNSGNQLGYHIYEEPDADTNYTWFVTNSNGVLGSNAVLWDIWTDPSDATWDYSITIDRPKPNWTVAGSTIYRNASATLGTTVFDTIRNANLDIIGTVQVTTEIVYGAYHMLVIMEDCDSIGSPFPYLYRFNTTGSGNFNLWSGGFIGWNNIVNQVMDSSLYPNVVNYLFADTNQTIVSSWNCSEKVVSVGNMRNRLGHIDFNSNQYYPSEMTPPGKLAMNSSLGPNRNNFTKPDIVAAGDVALGAGPLWFLQNPANNGSIDEGGMHIRNGGTSMAAPVVAGIAALYLERCGKATYQDFIDDMKNTAYTDAFTGTVPNNSYGYGKIHALDALLATNLPSAPTITSDWGVTLTSSSANDYQWFLDGDFLPGETNQDLTMTPPFGSYQVEIANTEGCTAISNPFVVTVGLEQEDLDLIQTYPNPASSVISIESELTVLSATLISMDGTEVLLKELTQGTYSLSSVPTGSYILRIDTGKGIHRSKVIRL